MRKQLPKYIASRLDYKLLYNMFLREIVGIIAICSLLRKYCCYYYYTSTIKYCVHLLSRLRVNKQMNKL